MDNKNQIVKPITLIRKELIDNLTFIINESHLPPFIIESILKDMYLETKALSDKVYESDKRKYEQAILRQECNENIENDKCDEN